MPVDGNELSKGANREVRLRITAILDGYPSDDDPEGAWDYDLLRSEILRIASERRYNLQETLVHTIYRRLAAMRGVAALRVKSAKPDIYKDAHAVGVEIASFAGLAPEAGPNG